MKNKFTQLYLCSLVILTMGAFETIFYYTKPNTADGFTFGIIKLFVGIIFLVFTITYHIKCHKNRKQLESELSKEYDERDTLIDGKAASFTMSILMIVILLMMFISRWISISTDAALFIIIIFCMLINELAKKYYSNYP